MLYCDFPVKLGTIENHLSHKWSKSTFLNALYDLVLCKISKESLINRNDKYDFKQNYRTDILY